MLDFLQEWQLEPLRLVSLALILSFGIFVQSAAGFAAGLITIPALLWAGFSIPQAQISLLVATIPQNIWGVYHFRQQIHPTDVAGPAILRLLFLPVGLWGLLSLETLPPVLLRQIVGITVLVVTLTIIWCRPSPRDRLHPGWSLLAFSASGFLQGIVGMGGPAMVLWVQAHDWDTKRSRGFLFTMYLISLGPAIFLLGWMFGRQLIIPAVTALILVPLLLWMTSLGLRAGTWLGRSRLRKLTQALLILLGLAGLAAPWLSS